MRSVLILDLGRERGGKALADRGRASGACALLLRLGPSQENEARREARAGAQALIAAARGRRGRPRLFAQIAPASGPVIDADLAALALPGLDGVFLEGCEGRADAQHASVKLAVREAEAGLAPGSLAIVALAAQTPAGVFALGRFKDATARLAALAIDETPLPGGAPARAAARALLVLGAAAAGIDALEFAPPARGAALAAACQASRGEGFSGQMSLFAEQIPLIDAAFGPA